jgi:hypothetical protein
MRRSLHVSEGTKSKEEVEAQEILLYDSSEEEGEEDGSSEEDELAEEDIFEEEFPLWPSWPVLFQPQN